MRGAVILVGHIMAAVREGGLYRHRIIDTIRARIRDRPEGSSARHLPEGRPPRISSNTSFTGARCRRAGTTGRPARFPASAPF